MIMRDFFRITRFPSHEVIIGERPLGGLNPIRLQSMTNTNTLDVEATIAQSIRIIEAGADYVRIAAPNIRAAEALKEIKNGIRKAGFSHPLIADIHFNAEVALTAARYVEKVRINPGNYTGGASRIKTHITKEYLAREKEQLYTRLKPLVQACKEHGTAIRIGTNLGSLSPAIINRFGNSPEGMVQATLEFLEAFRELDFHQLVISLKASKPIVMVQAYERMVELMLENQMTYPLHIGITEAGEGENGRIKSALGICNLLNKGIGDTLRVSLTEAPELEIPFAGKLSSVYQIPFTLPDNDKKYLLKKSCFSSEEILVTEEKLKAVVIAETHNEQKTAQYHSSSPGSIIAKLPEAHTMADFCFTASAIASRPSFGKQWLVTPQTAKELPGQNVTLLIEMGSEKIPPIPNYVSGFFIRGCCKDPIRHTQAMNDKRFLGLVADMNSCNEEVNLDAWVAFSQQNQVPLILRRSFQTADSDELISHFAMFAGNYLMEKKIQGIWIHAPFIKEDVTGIAFGFLQSAGLRITKTEFISCPTCARTSFDLQSVLKQVQKVAKGWPGLKIAVMGCVVNGPGEMADADFGFVGTGAGKLHLYKGQKILKKNIEISEAPQALLHVLKEAGYKPAALND
ncbi:MAG: 4-hydroxy-3-methylbut-2-en-1-yl diphosphate synthase [Bacteroidetes bacterium]|nr:MAG: 4-hydroxy-3-methylbut-2-en-1-yl diphosphate synthase [Bacteroidota bacterium]